MTPEDPVGGKSTPSTSLATRITVIVFWGLALIGVALAFFLLHDLEAQVERERLGSTDRLGYQVESHLGVDARVQPGWLDRLRRESGRPLAVEIYRGDERLVRSGDPSADAGHVLEREVHAPSNGDVATYSIAVHWPPLDDIVQTQRNRVLLGLGLLLLVFGVLLHRILERVLARPMARMYRTAQSISEGQTELRFNSERDDELGYLAAFINQGLDTVLRQRDRLTQTLEQLNESQHNLQLEKERAQTTLASIGDAVVTTDAEGRVLYMNAAAQRLTGWTIGELQGQPFMDWAHFLGDGDDTIDGEIARALREGEATELTSNIDLVRRDQQCLPVHLSLAPLRHSGAAVPGCVVVIRDVSDTRRLHRELSYQATHDPVTGLYNRRELEEQIHLATQDAAHSGTVHCLCYVDLDRFRIVNDTQGHNAGDELICQAAERVAGRLRRSDLLARLGADEFAVLLRYCPVDKASTIAAGIASVLADEPFRLTGASFRLSASIGVIPVTGTERHVSDLITAADTACSAAKADGGNRVRIARPDDEDLERHRSEIAWVTELDEILTGDRLRLFCQPIVPTHAPEARDEYEVLLRMTDPEGTLVSPATFIPIAERYGLMPRLDRWVVEHALRFLADRDPDARLSLSINLSAQSLCEPAFLEFVTGQLDREDMPSPSRICFEITETAAMRNIESATRFISELRSRGCRFALDDFGSGLSSFGYLKQLDVDLIKIDGAFIRNIVNDRFDRAMVNAVTELAAVMGIATVAEFVEDESVLEVVRDLGVNYGQGFGIGKPQPIEEIRVAPPTRRAAQRGARRSRATRR